jgi:Ni2+-binding GTPase involved in maturation of urease and hydrogenase
MYNIFEDEDDIFMGSPKSKFLDVVFNANRGVVDAELERVIERMAVLELMLNVEDAEHLEKKIAQYAFENSDEVQTKAKSLFIESMGNVLTQCE